MTLASAETARLDRALAARGQEVVLRRYLGVGAARAAVDATVRAAVRDYMPREITGGIVQGDVKVIVSPTDIIAAQWPGPQGWPEIGDRVLIDGRDHRIEAAPVVRVGGVVVRIDIQARG